MSKTSANLAVIWNNIKEIDLRPLRDEALRTLTIAIVGAPASGRRSLAEQIRTDQHRSGVSTNTPVLILDIDQAAQAPACDLIILLLHPQPGDTPDSFSGEQALVKQWGNLGRRVLVLVNQPGSDSSQPWLSWGIRQMIYGPTDDPQYLLRAFVPLVMEMLPDRLLALGRAFPLFRVQIAHHLINDTCMSNAIYALSTGVAEVVPVLDIPLNVTDMIVLTKNQAFLAYKLGLALGFSTEWRDYLAEFSSVLGSGFVWRQLARSLIGLIPAWGIVPKVGISYAGTYVVGSAILQWYLTGRHVSRAQLKDFYLQALGRGKHVAEELLRRLPRPHLPRLQAPRLPLLNRPRTTGESTPAAKPVRKTGKCPQCGRKNPKDAVFCAYCAQPMEPPIVIEAGPEG